jgi:hypothetical protein
LSLIRKVFWPAAVALGFLAFLGATGSSDVVRTASAAEGKICQISGPTVIGEGNTYLYVAWIEDQADDDEYIVSIDNISGASRITSDLDGGGDYDQISPTNLISDLEAVEATAVDEDIIDLFLEEWGVNIIGNPCGDSVATLLAECIDAENEGITKCQDEDANELSSSEQSAFAKAVNDLLAAGENDCDELAQAAREAALAQGAKNAEVDAADDFVDTNLSKQDPSGDEEEDSPRFTEEGDADCEDFLEDLLVVDVTCDTAGEFTISFSSDDEDDDSMSLDVICLSPPDDSSTIARTPDTVEIVPALGNVSHSLVTVTLQEDGEQAGPGYEVDFTVDRCTIETGGVDTAAEYGAARTVFTGLNRNYYPSADAIEASPAATAAVDSSRQQDTTKGFFNTAGDTTVAAAILGCNPADTGPTPATPGVATITAVIEVKDGQDIVLRTTVTVVGPPASVTVAAAPASLRCGEKATVTATVKDAIGQNVSEHTRVEAVTNAGGVLGGTGAVAGQAGPVVPISSTVAETFSGVATFYLLTSEQHSGPYEVVVTSGGNGAVTSLLGGVFSTPPISAQATVSCTVPVIAAPVAPVAPTVTAPRTGTGTISPPNTGDAGLVDQTGSSWALFVAVGAVAFAVAGLATLKFARR